MENYVYEIIKDCEGEYTKTCENYIGDQDDDFCKFDYKAFNLSVECDKCLKQLTIIKRNKKINEPIPRFNCYETYEEAVICLNKTKTNFIFKRNI